MIILLYGEDTYRLRQKLKEIVSGYKSKHQSGLSFARFDEKNFDFSEVKNIIEAVSMFSEKKLIILENVVKEKDFQKDFFEYAKKNKIKNNQDIIAVLFQEGKLAASVLKKKVNMFEEFLPLKGTGLTNWIKKEVSKNGGVIDSGAVNELSFRVGGDLWQMSNEIGKLVGYKKNNPITKEDVVLMVKSEADLNIFAAIDALAARNKKDALRLLHQHLNQGVNENYLFSMFVYQIRNLLKIKDLMEKGTPFPLLAAKSGLHPFVARKTAQQAANFSLDQLQTIYRRLLEIETKTKTGRAGILTALDLFVVEI
ncbi:DNA polymerase III subunit delta [Patescibacteria group bacterium]|nr:DNA polymerase III subunit delta [Patescibacteria group bacterium]MBU4082741.1 DNA polymerase III subunit delta [Patescibacteria group bacterium]